ncbi:unnamed protein product, partial [Cuscuta epithymum]
MDKLVKTDHLKKKGNWMHIWELAVPPKVRMFMWRLGRDCLPNRSRLREKGIFCPNVCETCGGGPENNWHIFLNCNESVAAWCHVGLWDKIEFVMQQAECFGELFMLVLEKFMAEELRIFAMTAWSIWRRRNVLCWENVRESVQQVLSRGAEVLHTWDEYHGKARVRQKTTECNSNWKPPPWPALKCNVDAAIFIEDGRAGMGCCVRDHQGHFYMAMSEWCKASLSPVEAKVWGLRQAMSWMQNMDHEQVIFEMDSKQVVQDVHSAREDISEYGSLLEDCKSLLATKNNFKVVFTRRKANSSAHALARKSINYAS